MPETARRIVLASRPHGRAEAFATSAWRNFPCRSPAPGSSAAHHMAFARPVHARAHERRAVLRQAGRRRRGDGRRHGQRGRAPRTIRVQAGDIVLAARGWQTHAVSDGAGLRKLDPKLAPVSTALGVLGMPGMTAYTGLLDIGAAEGGRDGRGRRPRPARSARSSARSRRSRARAPSASRAGRTSATTSRTSSASTPASITARRIFAEKLKAACPKGIDVYFENVGGRGVGRGAAAAQYVRAHPGVRPDRAIQRDRAAEARRTGAAGCCARPDQAAHHPRLHRHGLRRAGTAIPARRAQWLKDGKIKYREDIAEGLENAPQPSWACSRARTSASSSCGSRSKPMTIQMVLLPVFVQVALTFALLFWMASVAHRKRQARRDEDTRHRARPAGLAGTADQDQQLLQQPVPDPAAVLRAGHPRLDHQTGRPALRRDGVDLRDPAPRARLYPHHLEPCADALQVSSRSACCAAGDVDHLRRATFS